MKGVYSQITGDGAECTHSTQPECSSGKNSTLDFLVGAEASKVPCNLHSLWQIISDLMVEEYWKVSNPYTGWLQPGGQRMNSESYFIGEGAQWTEAKEQTLCD